ncbi:glycosyltransferase family 4 protein [Pseudomonas oleovorans]|uniref:glycosyltransferase family 4 protein n=3 Tax=Ectopseudomonas oleovorans TaxID=301 RepID=UPI001F153EFD|nr:glycosyltransferase family 4 protein [Pseudomonas oleovorans]
MGGQAESRAVSVHMLVWNDFCNDARVLKEAQTLQAAGYAVVVHAIHVPGKTAQQEVLEGGIDVRRVPLRPFGKGGVQPSSGTKRISLVLQVLSRLWGHMVMLRRLIGAHAGAIHAHDVNTLPTAWLAAKITGARLVYDAHEISTSREGYVGLSKLVSAVESSLMPKAAGTITTTDARAKFFARAYHVSRPLVLQNRPRHQAHVSSQRIRDELDLTQPWPIILYQGGLQSGRGLECLLRVVPQVPSAYFVYIGGGRLQEHLHNICDELDLRNRVFFIPTVRLAELPSYTASADIGVQPIENTCLNHYTTDSNKLFEYVQAGLPVVASDLPEIRRIVRQHDLGLLVPAGDSDALADALRRMVSDAGLRQHHAQRARAAAAALSWEVQEHLLVDLYRRVLG